MIGVNIPGHFFVAPASPDMEFLVDAFEGEGLELDRLRDRLGSCVAGWLSGSHSGCYW